MFENDLLREWYVYRPPPTEEIRLIILGSPNLTVFPLDPLGGRGRFLVLIMDF